MAWVGERRRRERRKRGRMVNGERRAMVGVERVSTLWSGIKRNVDTNIAYTVTQRLTL